MIFYLFFLHRGERKRREDGSKEKEKKRKYAGLYSRLDQAGIFEGVPIRDRPFRGKLDPSTF